VARYQRMLQAFPGLQAELKQVNNNQQLDEYYFSAETSALAGAKVQGKVKEIISSSGGSLTSTQVLSGIKSEPTQKVQVRVQMRGDTATLIDVLYKIEEARPLLFIEQLSVRAQARRSTRRTTRSRRAKARQAKVPPLTVRLDIYGFVQPERQG
jgi:general secretion pathway protein M